MTAWNGRDTRLMKDKAYILQPDIKAHFPNWDEMTKEEQQKWESDFEAMKKGKRKRVKKWG